MLSLEFNEVFQSCNFCFVFNYHFKFCLRKFFDRIKIISTLFLGNNICKFNFFIGGSDNQLTNLTIGKLKILSQPESGQYLITEWYMEREKIENENGSSIQMISVNMGLRRRITSIFMMIYLPLIIMNILNQASFYLTTEDKYQMVINVNITCLLALASVYLAVASSLPSTSSIKPVEYFLIYNILYPFFTILLAVIIQVHLGFLLYNIIMHKTQQLH